MWTTLSVVEVDGRGRVIQLNLVVHFVVLRLLHRLFVQEVFSVCRTMLSSHRILEDLVACTINLDAGVGCYNSNEYKGRHQSLFTLHGWNIIILLNFPKRNPQLERNNNLLAAAISFYLV